MKSWNLFVYFFLHISVDTLCLIDLLTPGQGSSHAKGQGSRVTNRITRMWYFALCLYCNTPTAFRFAVLSSYFMKLDLHKKTLEINY